MVATPASSRDIQQSLLVCSDFLSSILVAIPIVSVACPHWWKSTCHRHRVARDLASTDL